MSDAKRSKPGPCSMTKPCENCPFLKVGFIQLNPGRVRGIVKHLLESDYHGFPCHKTTDAGTNATGAKVKECAGAMIYRLKAQRPSVLMRVCAIGQSEPYAKLMKAAPAVIDHPYKGKR